MTVTIARSRVRQEKKKIRRQMAEHGVMVKNVIAAFDGRYFKTSVWNALNPTLPYWNQEIADKALALIEEKRQSAQ